MVQTSRGNVDSPAPAPPTEPVMCLGVLPKPLRGHLLNQTSRSRHGRASRLGMAEALLARHSRGNNSRLHSSNARASKRVMVHKLDRRRGPRNQRRGRQWWTATVRRSREDREGRLRDGGLKVMSSATSCRQVSGRATDAGGNQRQGLGLTGEHLFVISATCSVLSFSVVSDCHSPF